MSTVALNDSTTKYEEPEVGVVTNELVTPTFDLPETDCVAEEWQMIAQVLDYVFFYLYLLCVVLCTLISFRLLIFRQKIHPL